MYIIWERGNKRDLPSQATGLGSRWKATREAIRRWRANLKESMIELMGDKRQKQNFLDSTVECSQEKLRSQCVHVIMLGCNK